MNIIPTHYFPLPSGVAPDYSNESRRYSGSMPQAIQSQHSTVDYDVMTQTWGEVVFVNGRPRSRRALLTSFLIADTINIVATDRTLRYIIVRYQVNGELKIATLRAEDYTCGRIYRFFEGISRLPGCSPRKASDTLGFLIAQHPSRELIIFERQGFQALPDGTVVFGYCPASTILPPGILPPGVQKRQLMMQPVNLDELFSNWQTLYQNQPVLLFIGLMRVAALMLFFLKSQGIHVDYLFCLVPSVGVSREKLCALLNTNCPSSPIPQLNWTVARLRHSLAEVYDGVAVIEDRSFADKSALIDAQLRFLLQKQEADGIGRNLTAVVSENAAYAAQRIAADQVVTLSLDGVELKVEPQNISMLTCAVDSVLIKWMAAKPAQTKALIMDRIASVASQVGEISDPDTALFCALISAEALLRQISGREFADNNQVNTILQDIFAQRRSLRTSDETILHEFGKQISKRIRSGEYSVIRKCKGLQIDPESQTAILIGNRLLISRNMMCGSQRNMTTTGSQKGIIRALRQNGLLNTTDGDTRPIEVHDPQGVPRRLYLYDISLDVLDSDIIHMLQNLEASDFWLKPDELPQSFLPLLHDGQGRIAGKVICNQDAENGHSFTTGQSGIGKSFQGCQHLAHCHSLGHMVIAFETGDSFTREPMIRNLSQSFVDNEMRFYDIDRDGLPINPSISEQNVPLTIRKRQLMNVLFAALGELSAPQTNLLRTVISSLLVKDALISFHSILSALPRDNPSSEALRSRLEPLAEDLKECGMREGNWGDILNGERRVLVFRTDSAYTEHGSQLIDILLCTLLEFGRGNAAFPVDIFIDEIQNQNFAASSPLRKIMKEGRKYSLSVHGLTQDFYPRSTDIGSVMGKAGTLVFLHPTQNAAPIVASELRWGKAEMNQFDSMERGDAVIKAPFYNKIAGYNQPVTLRGKVYPFSP